MASRLQLFCDQMTLQLFESKSCVLNSGPTYGSRLFPPSSDEGCRGCGFIVLGEPSIGSPKEGVLRLALPTPRPRGEINIEKKCLNTTVDIAILRIRRREGGGAAVPLSPPPPLCGRSFLVRPSIP
jgi:hypothetical protein